VAVCSFLIVPPTVESGNDAGVHLRNVRVPGM
jgi:hypothetical protein